MEQKKPSPEIFFHTLKKSKIEPHQALFIRGGLRRDIETAQEIGMITEYIIV